MRSRLDPLRAVAFLSLLGLACNSDGSSGSSAVGSVQATSGFLDACGDGTVLDDRPGSGLPPLLWETKTGNWQDTSGATKPCGAVAAAAGNTVYRSCPDVRAVENRYTWCVNTDSKPFNCDQCEAYSNSAGSALCAVAEGLDQAASGSVQTDFIDLLNEAGECFAGFCDWRIPTAEELQRVMVGPDAYDDPTYGQPQSCVSPGPCLDAAFGETPTAETTNWYWTSTPGTPTVLPTNNQKICNNFAPCQSAVNFSIGALAIETATMEKTIYTRAVRTYDPNQDPPCTP